MGEMTVNLYNCILVKEEEQKLRIIDDQENNFTVDYYAREKTELYTVTVYVYSVLSRRCIF